MAYMIGPHARARGAAGAVLTALPRKAEGARPPGAMEKAEADATKAARRATVLVAYIASMGEVTGGEARKKGSLSSLDPSQTLIRQIFWNLAPGDD